MKQKTPAVKNLSRFFIFILTLIILAVVATLYLAFTTLPPYAATVNEKLSQANLISSTSGSPSSNAIAQRTALFFASPSTAKDQAAKDILAYARLSGVSVSSVEQSGQPTATTVPISVSIDKPLPYASFMQFLATLEGSVPHLAVTSVTMTQASEASQEVRITSLTLNVAIR